jgi:hypothetical protein
VRLARCPGDSASRNPPDLDASFWLFEVERGSERRRVEVLISGPAKLSTNPEVRFAVERNDQSALVETPA